MSGLDLLIGVVVVAVLVVIAALITAMNDYRSEHK